MHLSSKSWLLTLYDLDKHVVSTYTAMVVSLNAKMPQNSIT